MKKLDTVDSGKAERENLLQFKENSDLAEEMLAECSELLKEMEEEQENERQERLLERFQEKYQEFNEEYKGLKPSIERIMSNKQLMKKLE